MERQRYVFRRVNALSAVAVGRPGSRRFYIVAGEGDKWVRIWMEKEELQSLAAVITEMLETIVQGGHQAPLEDSDRVPEILREPGLPPEEEFQLNQLAVGYDEGQDRIGLFAYGPGDNRDKPILTCWISRPQALTLEERIEEVCAAGRPPCQLCGGPLDPEGHVCPKANGHRDVII